MGYDTDDIEETVNDYDVADPSQRPFIFNKIQWCTIEFLNNMIIKDAFFDDSSFLLRLDNDFQSFSAAGVKELAKQYCERAQTANKYQTVRPSVLLVIELLLVYAGCDQMEQNAGEELERCISVEKQS